MIRNLLQEYDCSDFAELYKKLKNGEADELATFLENRTSKIKYIQIKSFSDMADFLTNLDLDESDYIVFADTKGFIRSFYKVDEGLDNIIDKKEFVEFLFNNYSSNYFLVSSEIIADREMFRNILGKETDIIFFDPVSRRINSERGQQSLFYSFNDVNCIMDDVIDYKEASRFVDISNASDIDRFINFYLSKELPGLPLNEAQEKLQNVFAGSPTEKTFIMGFDKNNLVVDFNIINYGDYNSCFVDKKILYNVINESEGNGIVFGHNHPSGDPTESNEDNSLFKIIESYADICGKKCSNIILGDTINIVNGEEYFKEINISKEKVKEKKKMKQEPVIGEKEIPIDLPGIERFKGM